jgi:hypothetical protein
MLARTAVRICHLRTYRLEFIEIKSFLLVCVGVKLGLKTDQVTGKFRKLQNEKFLLAALLKNIMWMIKSRKM